MLVRSGVWLTGKEKARQEQTYRGSNILVRKNDNYFYKLVIGIVMERFQCWDLKIYSDIHRQLLYLYKISDSKDTTMSISGKERLKSATDS